MTHIGNQTHRHIYTHTRGHTHKCSFTMLSGHRKVKRLEKVERSHSHIGPDSILPEKEIKPKINYKKIL